MEKITDWDIAEALNTTEDIISCLSLAFEENDITFLVKVIGSFARSYGMSKLSKELGLTREGLYKSLSSEGNPSFSTVAKVLDALGYCLDIKPKKAA